VAYFAGVQLHEFPHLHKWWEKIHARPAVQKGLAIPSPSQFGNQRYQERLKEDSEFKKKEEELAELCKKAKEQYGYKYASP
jgi:glutathione S-transferase